LKQQIIYIETTTKYAQAPAGMVLISGGQNYQFFVQGVEIEGDPIPNGVDVQYSWEDYPRRVHNHTMNIQDFYIDKYPVTNQQFKQFLSSTHYIPADSYNFLKHWKNGTFPAGWDKKPVTWISIVDARVYAKWADRRLPNEWEWQLAAQGTQNRVYPWGNNYDPTMVPKIDKSRELLQPPDDVDAHEAGVSVFGVFDLVGNVWQWTNEFVDDHTRAAIVRGGSYYQPQGSMWYFPQAYELNKHGKYLLLDDCIDRSALIGFRTAADK